MFIPASKLKRRYTASGRFYRVESQTQIIIPCRSTLEIYTREFEFESQEPDAYVVMENPGGSESLEISSGHIDGPLYFSSDLHLARRIYNTVLTRAKPDRTQYQVMRLMDFYQWNYVRVLNLSDIRTTSSTQLIDLVTQQNDNYHCIFSEIRNEELTNRIPSTSVKPVIAAWGANDGLRDLANLAMSKLPDHIRGLQGNQPFKFLHPLPRKYGEPRKWLKRFLNEVEF